MTTVKEFKDLGGEFVADDELSGRRYKRIFAAEHLHDLNIRNLNTDDAKLAITSFAWRPLNTLPDNPKFKFEYNSGSIRVQWRPLLEQPKQSAYDVDAHVSVAKPIFTQAMADNKQLPPIGSKFLHHIHKVSTCLSTSSYSDGVVTFEYINEKGDEGIDCCFYNSAWVKPLDTRTPKQKAVDALSVDILAFYGYADNDEYKLLADHLNKLGYEKNPRPAT